MNEKNIFYMPAKGISVCPIPTLVEKRWVFVIFWMGDTSHIEVPIGIEVSVVSGRFLVSVSPILWAPILRYFDTYILVYFEPKNWPIWTIFGSNYTHFYHARLNDVFHTEHIKYDMNMAFWLWPPEYLLVLYEIFMEFYCTKTWVSKYRSIADTFGKSIEVSCTSYGRYFWKHYCPGDDKQCWCWSAKGKNQCSM